MPSIAATYGGTNGLGTGWVRDDDPNDTSKVSDSTFDGIFSSGITLGGTTFTDIYININGTLNFGRPTNSYTPTGLSTGVQGVASIALFWTDLDTRATSTTGGSGFGTNLVYYGSSGNTVAYSWDSVAYFPRGTTAAITGQIQLTKVGTSDVDIKFIYQYTDVNSLSAAFRGGGAVAGLNLGVFGDALWGNIDYVQLASDTNPTVDSNSGTAGEFTFSIRSGALVGSGTGAAPSVSSGQTLSQSTLTATSGFSLGTVTATDDVSVTRYRFNWSTGKRSLTSEDGNFSVNQSTGEVTLTAAGATAFAALSSGGSLTSSATFQVSDGNNNGSTPTAVSLSLAKAAADTTAPTLNSSTPADDATAVAIGSNIVLNFSETVVAGSGNIVIKKSDGTTVATIAVSDPQVSISGSTVTINPTSDLLYSTSYYVEIASGVLKDSANNSYAGISGSTTLNFTTSSPSSGTSSDSGPAPQTSQPTVQAVDTTPTDPAPAGTNIQSTDADGDGLREVITASDGATVDGNRDGIPDVQQTEVAGLRLINDGAVGSDYGALVVSPEVRLSAVTLTAPTTDGSIPVTARGGGTVVNTTPDGITNAFAGVVSFNVSGVTPGGSTQATINFPTGLPANSGNAYVRFNYNTNRFEEYVDASGAPLYSFVDTDGDGVFDAVNLTLVDGDPTWDGDGIANGTVVDPGFLAVGERTFNGTKRKDILTGNILANTINGRKKNDWLQGGLGADVLIGGKGKDRYVYISADESTASARDTVRFGKGDRFVFSSFDGDSTKEGQQKLSFIGKDAFSGVAGELRATRSLLEADVNGDSLADFAVNLRRNFLLTERNLVL